MHTTQTIDARPLAVRPRGAAAMLGVSRGHLYELMAAGQIRSRRLGGARLIEVAEIERFIAGLPTDAPGSPRESGNEDLAYWLKQVDPDRRMRPVERVAAARAKARQRRSTAA